LETTRKEARLATLYTIRFGHTILDKNTFKTADYFSRRDHPLRLRREEVTRNYVANSFFHRTIKEWNL
jgi:hypothetical protein